MVREHNAAATTHTAAPINHTRLQSVSIHQMAPPVRRNKHPITAYYSVYRPRRDERLSPPGWLVTYRNKVPPPGVEPGHVNHPNTNGARRRVTSLIRPTQLPLRHAANQYVVLTISHCIDFNITRTRSISCVLHPCRQPRL